MPHIRNVVREGTSTTNIGKSKEKAHTSDWNEVTMLFNQSNQSTLQLSSLGTPTEHWSR